MKILMISISLLFIGCLPESRYSITIDGIQSNTNTPIKRFNISVYKGINNSFERQYDEINRYCFENKSNRDLYKVEFYEPHEEYFWIKCKLDLTIVENDSLSQLSEKEKLDYIKKYMSSNNQLTNHNKLPIEFKRGYVYHFFGFTNLNGGSYYVKVDEKNDNKMNMKYYDGGAW